MEKRPRASTSRERAGRRASRRHAPRPAHDMHDSHGRGQPWEGEVVRLCQPQQRRAEGKLERRCRILTAAASSRLGVHTEVGMRLRVVERVEGALRAQPEMAFGAARVAAVNRALVRRRIPDVDGEALAARAGVAGS